MASEEDSSPESSVMIKSSGAIVCRVEEQRRKEGGKSSVQKSPDRAGRKSRRASKSSKINEQTVFYPR
jgi:hypothetical protein